MTVWVFDGEHIEGVEFATLGEAKQKNVKWLLRQSLTVYRDIERESETHRSSIVVGKSYTLLEGDGVDGMADRILSGKAI